MPLATAADAPVFEVGSLVFRSLAVPSRGSSEIALWTVDVPADTVGQTHQADREEVFYVLEGTITIQDKQAGPGDVVVVPPHTDLALVGGPARLVVATSVGINGLLGGQKIIPPWSL